MSAAPDRGHRPPSAAPRATPMPAFSVRTLSTGTLLFTAPTRKAPLVELDLLLAGGGERNPLERPGLASLVAALLDEGTARRSGPEIAAELERRGAALGTGSDWNATSLRLSLPASELDFAVGLLVELWLEPEFPERELDRLRRQFLAEIARRVDQPAVLAEEALASALFPGEVYAYPTLGTRESLAAIDRAEVARFHGAHSSAASARLVAAGDLEPDRLAETLERALARTALAPAEPLPPRSISTPPRRGLDVVIVDRPHAAQTELRVGHVGVARRDPDRIAFGFLNSLLGGKFTSRINLNLRERLGITYGASSRLSDRRSPGPFVVACAVATPSSGLAAREILGELARLRSQPATDSEIEETRSYLLGVFPYGLQTVEGLAARLRDIALHDLPLDHPRRVLDEYRTVDAARLLEVARRHLRPESALVVAAGPAEALAPQLAELGPVRILQPAAEG